MERRETSIPLKRFAVISALGALFVPALSLADDQAAIDRAEAAADGFLTRIEVALVFPLVSLLLGIAFLVFLFGVFEYIKGSANESDRAVGQRHMLFGIIGMIVMLSAVAILSIARNTFGV